MLKIIAMLIGVLFPLSFISDGQPDSSQGMNEPTAQHTVNYAEDEIAAGRPLNLGTFETMNGISLQDNKNDVIAKKGKPLKITQDRFTGCTEYHYQDAGVVICDGIVDYVRVAVSAEKMKINGSWIILDKDNIRSSLGKPQFVAEDGQVFIRGHHVIKVYADPDTGALLGADFFDKSSE